MGSRKSGKTFVQTHIPNAIYRQTDNAAIEDEESNLFPEHFIIFILKFEHKFIFTKILK